MAADFGSQGRDVILEWNAVMLQADASDHARTSPQQGGPILAGRAFAIVSAAMYDAYNSIEKIGEAYLVTAPPTRDANSDAAVAQAAHDTLVALYPAQKSTFDKALKQTLERIRNGRSEDDGRKVGAFVAEGLLAARADDGSVEIMQPAYVSNGLAGFHDVDPLHAGQGFYAAGAMNVDPFAISSLEDFPARQLDDGTPAGRAAFLQSEEYTRAYEEVMALGGDGDTTPTERTAEQTVIGIYWGYDGRPGLGTPPRLYNQIVRTIADKKDNTEAENARLFALVNIAMADAGLAAWNDKYDLAFWRPILGIRNGDADGNVETTGDADWRPLARLRATHVPGRRISRRPSRLIRRDTRRSGPPRFRCLRGSIAATIFHSVLFRMSSTARRWTMMAQSGRASSARSTALRRRNAKMPRAASIWAFTGRSIATRG